MNEISWWLKQNTQYFIEELQLLEESERNSSELRGSKIRKNDQIT